jgi:hypothetical protein
MDMTLRSIPRRKTRLNNAQPFRRGIKILAAKGITTIYLHRLNMRYAILLNIAFFTASKLASTVNNRPWLCLIATSGSFRP